MSKTGVRLNTISKIVFLVLLALISISEPILVLVFFIPVVGWLIWRDQDRMAALEKRLAALEGPAKPEPRPEGA